jgi:hypothetical protein
MALTLEEVLLSVWRQTLIGNADAVVINGHKFRVRRTSRSELREVDFEFNGHTLRCLEQIPPPVRAGCNWHAEERKLCNS